jgi:hypothetical protein
LDTAGHVIAYLFADLSGCKMLGMHPVGDHYLIGQVGLGQSRKDLVHYLPYQLLAAIEVYLHRFQ